METSEILNWNITQLYNYFLTIVENNKIKNKIKYGINLQIPIYYITNEYYEIYPQSKKVNIKGFGKIDIDIFMNELEDRENLMRKIIIEQLDNGNIIEAR